MATIPRIPSFLLPTRAALWRVMPLVLACGLTLVSALVAHGIEIGRQYRVPLPTAIQGAARDAVLSAIVGVVRLGDPIRPRLARVEPQDTPDFFSLGFRRIEDTVRPNPQMRLVDFDNAHIVRSTFPFRYQPSDEPRLRMLAKRYGLWEIVKAAPTEFEGMVRLRHWSRSRFARDDYQPLATNFDALEVLERNYRNHHEPFSHKKFFDPCQFFPLLLSQVLLSVGHQARLVSADHGMVEVWSNQFRKWILFDAELDQHLERDGVPMNMIELAREYASAGPASPHVRVVKGARLIGEENPTWVHLRREVMTPPMVLPWFSGAVVLVDRRNDWMTNWYFPGHPARAEANSLIFCLSDQRCLAFENRLRPVTTRESDFNWSLNETEIWAKDPSAHQALALGFRTVTPNFDHFEIVQDHSLTVTSSATFAWRLHDGINSLRITSVNALGVRGIPSAVRVEWHDPIRQISLQSRTTLEVGGAARN